MDFKKKKCSFNEENKTGLEGLTSLFLSNLKKNTCILLKGVSRA